MRQRPSTTPNHLVPTLVVSLQAFPIAGISWHVSMNHCCSMPLTVLLGLFTGTISLYLTNPYTCNCITHATRPQHHPNSLGAHTCCFISGISIAGISSSFTTMQWAGLRCHRERCALGGGHFECLSFRSSRFFSLDRTSPKCWVSGVSDSPASPAFSSETPRYRPGSGSLHDCRGVTPFSPFLPPSCPDEQFFVPVRGTRPWY